MTRPKDAHVPAERLAVLALAPASGPLTDEDHAVVEHVAACAACEARLAGLTRTLDDLRDEAAADADARFPEATLAEQRRRVLDRLAHLGRAARVLAFPAARPASTMAAAPPGRRWITVAAAAGLIIGLVVGQTLHFLPGDVVTRRRAPAPEPVERTIAPAIVHTAATRPLTDDELLRAIDEAIELRAGELRALDELTPRLTEIP
ncbi:MAG: hypothetical protein AB1635_02045 [Acidobacteriota bacterium]